MMHKCIKVKIRRKQKTKIKPKNRKLNGTGGNIINFGEIGDIFKFCVNRGVICNSLCIIGLWGLTPLFSSISMAADEALTRLLQTSLFRMAADEALTRLLQTSLFRMAADEALARLLQTSLFRMAADEALTRLLQTSLF